MKRVGLVWVFGLATVVAACSQGVDSAASFTFGPPDATASAGEASTGGAEASTSGEDPTIGSGGVSDSASPTTGVEETTGPHGTTTTSTPTSGTPTSTTATPTECEPGETRPCYTGPANTENVGNCTGGTQTCGADGSWEEACEGELLPEDETCNGEDDDCNGTPDDGDPGGGAACNTGLSGPCQSGVLTCQGGDLVCEGDVTPAAEETCGNDIDDDCNGQLDDGCGCDPGNPGLDCAAGESCFPTETFGEEAICAGPMGAGVQYASCADNGDCAPGHVCVDVGTNVYCLQWCTSFAQCPGAFDDCVPLDPTVWDVNQEWGVCYDGLG